jgi:hypothetical protein
LAMPVAPRPPVLRSRSDRKTKRATLSPDELDELAPDMEMTTKEAAAYLSGPVGYTISPKFMYGLKASARGPVVEKPGKNLVYRRSALDALLRENGTDPLFWMAGA